MHSLRLNVQSKNSFYYLDSQFHLFLCLFLLYFFSYISNNLCFSYPIFSLLVHIIIIKNYSILCRFLGFSLPFLGSFLSGFTFPSVTGLIILLCFNFFCYGLYYPVTLVHCFMLMCPGHSTFPFYVWRCQALLISWIIWMLSSWTSILIFLMFLIFTR